MFIVIDGIDGAGKSTQVALLSKVLKKRGKKVKIIDFPQYGKESAYFVEQYLNGKYGKNISSELASTFFALDRFDFSQTLKKYLQKYDIIISNRYVSSNCIHQSGKKITSLPLSKKNSNEICKFVDWIENFEYQICKIQKPDTIFFLDVSPEYSKKLIEKKSQRTYIKKGNKDLHEKNLLHQKHAYSAGIFLAKKYGWEIIQCVEDSELLSKEKVMEKILGKIGIGKGGKGGKRVEK